MTPFEHCRPVKGRDSSVTTGTSAARIGPDYVTQVGWWEHPRFQEASFLESAELVAFDILNPVLRSRVAGTARAQQVLEENEDFREAMRSLFSSEPTGRLYIPTLQDALIRLAEETFHILYALPANPHILGVEPRGFEPLTSPVQSRHDSLLEISGACKIPANDNFLPRILCSSFQEFYSGCCTVAAQGIASSCLNTYSSRV